tara:strand:+ start:39 stop:488 length:450 start_codon:yes stop_codon:yes gene_type:complete
MQNTISFSTKFGWISATEIDNNVTKVQFGKIRKKGILSKNLKKVKKFLELYCKKKTKKTKIPIKIIGNKFQKKIWNEIRKINKGKTKTYGEIAKKLNISPRYVGRVCGENKHVLIIPCHRVVRSDGSFGGFSAPNGLKLKEKLLKFEKD